MNVHQVDRLRSTGADHAPPAAASVSLLLCLGALLGGVWPTWPLWTLIGLLGSGLVGAALTRRAGVRSLPAYVQSAAALGALLVIPLALPDAHPGWPISPLWIIAFVLGLGLVARGAATDADDWPGATLACTVFAAMLIVLWMLADSHWFLATHVPRTLRPDDGTAVAALRPLAALLGFTLVAATLPGRRTVGRLVSAVASAVVLGLVVADLVSPPGYGLDPQWAYDWMTVALACGLAAVVVPRLTSRPAARPLLDRIEELTRTRSAALDVQAAELRRIERDLHDGAQVQLVALSIKLGRAEDQYRDDPATATLLREARQDATTAIRELRQLARGIAPAVLVNRGLEAAVRSIAQRSGNEVAITADVDRRPAPAVERAAYFVVTESLANAAKHASGSRVEIDLRLKHNDLAVSVTDFGPGGADPAGGGLTGLRQRIEALDGHMRVTSPTGVGTQVEVVIPCGS